MHKFAIGARQIAGAVAMTVDGRMWRHGILLGFLLALLGSFSASYAQANRPHCGADEQSCRVSGSFSAASVANPTLPGVTSPNSAAFGALVYTDFVAIENVARERLDRAMKTRESISPYKGNANFDQLIRELDFEAGFNQPITATTPYSGVLNVLQLLTNIESDLTQARDYYAFLAVFAPHTRFRADGTYTSALCGATDKENPNPPDPQNSGLVKPPVIDWCNFPARLRQSVREAANVRMIIGQEFMVDALGMNFSGNFVGGEEFVKTEVARLRAAQNQFKLAEQFLTAGLKNVVGNGCRISDFYTDAEWSLLARSSERQGTIQYLVGSRLSYLGVSSATGAAQARATAVQTIRTGANDGYIKLGGVAVQTRTAAVGCALGGVPDSKALAEMALNVVETQRQAREILSGRNVFGFDVTFTPARAYKSSIALNCATNVEATRGLWDEAYCSAQLAQQMQERAENKNREFEASQTKLRETVDKMIQGLDKHIDDVVGCNRTQGGFPDDAAFFACARTQIKLATECLESVTEDAFDACMANPNRFTGNDIDTALRDLRSSHLEYQNIKTSAENVQKRIALSVDANKTVRTQLLIAGEFQTVAGAAQAAVDGISCVDADTPIGIAATTDLCFYGTLANVAAQTAAGAASTIADVEIADAEHKQEGENLLLDATELFIAAKAAHQAFFSKKSNTTGILTALTRDVIESERQRAYLVTSPANDPSFRIVRDSARLELAEVLERAAKIAYLAARRAEYEYAARLAASNFRISDSYRARTAQDILTFLDKLQGITNNLAGSATQERAALDIPKISVAKDMLLLTDGVLRSKGYMTPNAIARERTRQFQIWVDDHIFNIEGEARLVFTLTTSLQNSGIFDKVLPSGSDQQWRLMLGGVGSPEAGNTGVSVNLVTPQEGLGYRKVEVTQGGMVHLRSFAGCIFDYRLMAPATLLGLEWAKNQNPEVALDFFNANVNNGRAYSDTGFRSKRFEGRAVSATEWQIEIRSGAPESGLPLMDLHQLTDIELLLSATYSPRNEGTPEASECARVDY